MSNDPIRAALERLIKLRNADTWALLCSEWGDAFDSARAALAAAPEAATEDSLAAAPPAPLEGEAGMLAKWLYRLADERTCNRRRGIRPHPSALTRAATLLSQLSAAAPAVVPVAVSERLPGPEDCDAEWRCWIYQPWDLQLASPQWTLLSAKYASPYYGATSWLPAHALPLPAQGGEGQP